MLENIILSVFTSIALLAPQQVFSQQSFNSSPLQLTGKIEKTNTKDKKSYIFSRNELKKLGVVTVNATTDYSPNTSFSGPLLSSILEFVKINKDSTELIFTGLDGYKSRAPISDTKKYEVIVAFNMNNKPMTIQTKGPYWIIYPIDKYKSELNDVATSAKMVWNLVKIEVR